MPRPTVGKFGGKGKPLEDDEESFEMNMQVGSGRRRWVAGLVAMTALCWLIVGAWASLAPAAQAERLWRACTNGSGAGQCNVPRGVVADPGSGHVFVADQANRRIVELTAWGEFVKGWGWGVRDGSAELQRCGSGAVPPSATCQIALAGSGEGQFDAGSIQGLAMDSSGDIYAVDLVNRRVQKFDQEGNFLLMFGGDVNQTKVAEGAPESEQNRCPVDPGDVCQIGTTGTGAGQFEPWPFASFIAVGPGDVIYVGDKGRVQKFNPNGEHIGNLPDPEGIFVGEEVQALATAPSGAPNAGDLYLARVGEKDVLRLNPTTGVKKCTAKVEKPRAIASDADGDFYVVDGEKVGVMVELEVRKFGSDCAEVQDDSFPFHDGIDKSTGIATNAVTDEGDVDVYVANSTPNSSISAYGPPPGKWDPPEVPPSINATYATAVTTDSAVIRGSINPHFWDTTRYYLQYGTEECSKGGCKEQPLPPGTLLTAARVDEDVAASAILLSGLLPDTTYFYRFVAKTTFGPEPGESAEVRGVGGEVGLDGAESSFHTLVPPVALPPCPNDAVRTGASARLPDCRAYEMVSPGEKEGDVRGAEFGIGEVTPDGERITYSARFTPFADPESAPIVSQYLAERDPASGWSTRSIVPPTATPYLVFPPQGGLFDAFAPDLCRAWFLQESDRVLAPGAPAHFPSLYESDLCGAEGYRAIAPIPPPDHLPGVKDEPGATNTYISGVQGFSAGGEIVVFYANSKLKEEASDAKLGSSSGGPIYQLYGTDEAGEVHLISRLPNGDAADESSTLGSFTATTFGVPKDGTYRHAVSEDGSRVFWTCCGGSASLPRGGRIYLRLNPSEPQSALPDGSASGRGDLSAGSATVTNLVAAAGEGKITLGLSEITQLTTTVGSFQVGQPLVSSKFPPGTKITGCTPACGPEATALTLDMAATSFAPGKQPISSPGPMPFAVGQRVLGPGIPFGTTIEAAAAGSLTLSAPVTQTQAGAFLSSYSECSEPGKACTIPVSETASGAEAAFKTASPDGKRAIFSIGSKLYEYDTEAAIAGEAGAATVIAEGFEGFMGASEDASRVYFASSLDLGAGPNPEGELPVAGEANLYFRESGGALAFIGTLSGEDLQFAEGDGEPTPLGLLPGSRGSRVSPDGLHAAFHTSASLSEYDNAEATSGHRTVQVYLYDAPAGGEEDRLRCASCNPSGGRPKAVVVLKNLPVEYWAAALIPGWETEQQPSRLLSENGRRLFFEAYDALLPRDTNGVKDIYQWEAAGEGTCKAEDANYFDLNEGCISLISSGTSPQESRFIDASANGSDVFFETQSSLVGQDRGLVDVYDARIGGGFPPPPPIPPGCEGEACQSPAGAPSDPSPASSAYERNDNVKPKRGRCAKGKVRRKGRCVPKQRKGKQGKRQKRRAHAERRAAR